VNVTARSEFTLENSETAKISWGALVDNFFVGLARLLKVVAVGKDELASGQNCL